MASTNIKAPALPLPIFRISAKLGRYMLYDVDAVTWLRKEHHILGVFIGGLPQFPQQNLFFGIPLELMPEEALLLVDKGVGHIVEDLEWHKNTLAQLHQEHVQSYKEGLTRDGQTAADFVSQKKVETSQMAIRKHNLNEASVQSLPTPPASRSESVEPPAIMDEAAESLFTAMPDATQKKKSQKKIIGDKWTTTSATAFPLLGLPSQEVPNKRPEVNKSSYALFKHLHDRDYYSSPGLRFGCQFTVYPGDPLRFHSHFLATSAEWDEEFDLLDLIGGGRLGTGVKKGYLLGGQQRDDQAPGCGVRTFCIEWGGL